MFENIITEVCSSPLLMRQSAVQSLELLLYKAITGEKTESDHKPITKYASISVPDISSEGNPYDSFQENSIAAIPIIGSMLKYGSWWTGPGMDYYANLLRLADSSENIIGSILVFNTPGGSTQSIIQFEDALRNRTKPCIAFIDGMCCSAGIYLASLCDHIIAINPMCEIGSIGVQATLRDISVMLERWGIKEEVIRPPESKFKNTEFDEALNGNHERLIKEYLTPFAIHFQNIIKENRSGLDLSVEGLLEGKVFYAYDAVKNGLIDSIGNINDVINMIGKLHNEKKQFYSQLN